MFDKSEDLFPIRRTCAYLANSAIGPMYGPSADAARAFIAADSEEGVLMARRYAPVLDDFREPVAQMLGTLPENVAYVSNAAEGLNLVANGYPFEPGDQVISYVHEYPSNHHPWAMQRARGVELVLLSDVDPIGDLPPGRPRGWSMDELEAKTTKRTRVIALSHVQFASGFAADLPRLGAFCRERGIDLVVDAAQSMGALSLRPEEHGIAAVACSAWKWMMASRGAGLLYTTPDFRAKLHVTMGGDAMMKHRLDYLNHAFDPDDSARRFEYSTLPWEHLLAIETVARDVFVRYGMDAVAAEVFRIQDLILDALRTTRVRPVLFPKEHRSPILSVLPEGNPYGLVRALREAGVTVTTQAGYVRLAPHFYLSDDEALKAAEALNRLA